MTDPTEVAKIAGGLTKAQRKALLHREGAAEACMSWLTADYLYRLGLTQRHARFLRLTPLGLAVREHLERKP